VCKSGNKLGDGQVKVKQGGFRASVAGGLARGHNPLESGG